MAAADAGRRRVTSRSSRPCSFRSRGRGTLCISSQIGCALDCSFCATGAQGFNRNLTAAEIIGQVWLANRELGYDPDGERIVTNVVLMGMGEPLANYRNVLPAMQLMLDDLGYDLSRRRVTLSTSGLVPQIYRLAEDVNVALAVSLHAPNDRLRDELVPINRKHPIAELLPACWHYLERQNGRSVTFEYTMLDGVNDRPEHARELAKLLRGHQAKVNLIPFNTFPGTKYRRSPAEAIRTVSRPADAGRRHGDHPQDSRRRHRCGLRPAPRPGARPHAGAARQQARQPRGAGMSAARDRARARAVWPRPVRMRRASSDGPDSTRPAASTRGSRWST